MGLKGSAVSLCWNWAENYSQGGGRAKKLGVRNVDLTHKHFQSKLSPVPRDEEEAVLLVPEYGVSPPPQEGAFFQKAQAGR